MEAQGSSLVGLGSDITRPNNLFNRAQNSEPNTRFFYKKVSDASSTRLFLKISANSSTRNFLRLISYLNLRAIFCCFVGEEGNNILD